MDKMFLTELEVDMLTRRTRRKSQAIELERLGITFKIRSDGSFLILRAHVEELLGSHKPASNQAHSTPQDSIAIVTARITKHRKVKRLATEPTAVPE